jgi:hypothetical protein
MLPPRPALSRPGAHGAPDWTSDWWAPRFYLLRYVGLPADHCPWYMGWTGLGRIVVLLIEW